MNEAIQTVLLQETSKIISTALATDQIQGPDIELRIRTIYSALSQATKDKVRDIPYINKAADPVSSNLDEEAMLEVERVLERDARSPKLKIPEFGQ